MPKSERLGVNPSQVFDEVAKLYNVTPTEAESIVAYHGAFRLAAGTMVNASKNVGYFETKEGKVSKGVGLLAKLASIFPFGNVAEVAATGVREFDQFQNEQELKAVATVADAMGDNTHRFVKDLATDIVESSIEQLRGLTPQQASDRAKEDVRALKGKMADHGFDHEVKASQGINAMRGGDEQGAVDNLREAMLQQVQESRGIDSREERAKAEAKAVAADSHQSHHEHVAKGPRTQAVIDHEKAHAAHQRPVSVR